MGQSLKISFSFYYLKFEKLMEPVDEQVVNYLRNSVFGPMIDQNVSSLQIIKEMNKW
jgi:hypothetical protein